MLVVNLLMLIFLGTTSIIEALLRALYLVGIWKILEKSGIKGWWAIIPGGREFQLARCAGRESEGPVYSLSRVGLVIMDVVYLLINPGAMDLEVMTTKDILLLSAGAAVALVNFIYNLRVISGLIEVYGVKKRWIWLWLISTTEWIPALLWGFKKEYQPAWKIEDIRAEMERLASHGSATVMDKGLTVNLTDRTVTEYFQKKMLLRDIHMAIPQGHMVLLLGGSGAGKTTQLSTMRECTRRLN